MATRVLLFSKDEKAVHAITQILDELDIRFEHSSDSVFTLKRLAAQHFDLLIVDCDNPENATQLFNSVRASSANKSAIAVAIVEGKAGVPNAFRLGASLVLTKPVSLEQVRNTLRTGIGMTRKDGPETKPVAAATPPAPPVSSPSIPTPTPAPAPFATTHAAAAPAPAPISTPVPVAVAVPAPAISIPPAPAAPIVPAPVAQASPAPVVQANTTPAPTISAPPIQTPPIVAPPVVVPSAPEIKQPAAKVAEPAPPAAARVAAPPDEPTDEELDKEIAALIPQLHDSAPVKPIEISEFKPSVSEAKPAAPAPVEVKPSGKVVGFTVLTAGKGSAAAPAPAFSSSDLLSPLAKGSTTLLPPLDTVLPKEGSAADKSEGEETESAASLRAGAVPAFGGLGKQPFAGIEEPRRGRGALIGFVVVAALAGGGAAASLYVPSVHNFVFQQYEHIQQMIASRAAKPAQMTIPKPPAPAVPAPAQLQAPAPADASAPSPAPATDSTPGAPASTTPPSPVAATPQSAAPQASSPQVKPSPGTPASAPVIPAPAPAATTPSKPAPTPAPVPGKPAATAPAAPAAPAASPLSGGPKAAPAPATATPAPAAKASPGFIEVPEDFADDQVVHRVHPTYPRQARVKGSQGTVVLQAIVDKQGKVNSLQLISGDPVLGQAAADAVKQWRYKPYLHNGETVEFQTRVTVDFKLP
jgi:TonB family protein